MLSSWWVSIWSNNDRCDPTNPLAKLIDSVQINHTQPIVVEGRPCFLKQRLWGRSVIIHGGNLFLRSSNSKIVMFASTAQWQAWELHSYNLLYKPPFIAQKAERAGIIVQQLPGQRLRDYAESDGLTVTMLQAAAKEFRRTHQLDSSRLPGLWSHGDPHLGNVLYDPPSERAYLIDFETKHEGHLSVCERQADDLLVFLLDLSGRTDENWPKLSQAFLESYGQAEILAVLLTRLVVPSGLGLVLWRTRTNFLPHTELTARIRQLERWLRAFLNPA